jgi:hypothetical protein
MSTLRMCGFVVVASQLLLAASAAAKPSAAAVKRGEYLVTFGGCNHCHTPWALDKEIGGPRPDHTRLLSGHPAGGPDPASKHVMPDIGVIGPTFTSFALPFGIVYATNLTPDKDTGLGSWTEAMFIKTLRNGRHMGGEPSARPVLPPMPWEDLGSLTDADLKAIFAYLQSIPPIKNAVPDPKVPPPVLEKIGAAVDKVLARKAKPAK